LVTGAIALFATAYATNFMGFKDAVDAAVGFVVDKLNWLKNALFEAADTAKKALSSFTDWVGGSMNAANNAIQDFINSICFAHAIGDAVESSKKDLRDFVSYVDSSMGKALGSIMGFNRRADLSGLRGGSMNVSPVLHRMPEQLGVREVKITNYFGPVTGELDLERAGERMYRTLMEKLERKT